MYHLIYISTARKLFTDNDLLKMLTISVKNNTLTNVTGFLIYVEGRFIQVLEGKKTDVEFIFDKILNNNTHHQITVIERHNIKKRNFETWSMGFKSLSQNDELISIDGYSSISSLKSLDKQSDVLNTFMKFF
jgi:hypothetical protein